MSVFRTALPEIGLLLPVVHTKAAEYSCQSRSIVGIIIEDIEAVSVMARLLCGQFKHNEWNVQLPAQNETPVGIIVFRIAGRELCFDIKFLTEILRPSQLEVYQQARLDARHLIDFNGEHYFTADLTLLRGTDGHFRSDTGRILLVEYMEHKVAFLVDNVAQIISGTPGKDGLFSFVQTGNVPNCLGYYEIQGRKLWKIDLDIIIRHSPSLRRAI